MKVNIENRVLELAEGPHHTDFAGPAFLQKLHTGDIVRRNAAVCADPDDAAGSAGGIDHSAAFHNGVADGLFDIDVCAGIHHPQSLPWLRLGLRRDERL